MPNDRNNKYSNNDKTIKYRPERNRQAASTKRSGNRNTSSRNNTRTGQATKRISTQRTPTGKRPTAQNKKTNKNMKKKGKFSERHPKLMIFIKLIIILILLLCVIGAGIVAAMFFGVFGDDFEITKEDLVIGSANSVVLDRNGAEIANLSKEQQRKIISLDEMADYLPKAYVAIEDKRFYDHDGVDWKRTLGAIGNTVLKGGSSYGGSSITQQLVKNITGDKDSSGIAGIMRKVKEWTKAYQVERMISKQQILELYLNILFIGGQDIHGVELGAQYYFSKSAKDLDLAQCAFLAGINSSPNSYNPFDETKDQEKVKETIKKKVLTVLKEMKDQGYIENEEDYNNAVAEAEAGLVFTKGNVENTTDYSYHTDAALKQIINQVMKEKNVTREFAEKYVYSSGLVIYTTEDPGIQSTVEQEFSKSKYILKGREKDKTTGQLKNEHSQAGMAIIDYKTGEVLAVGGNLGEQQTASGWNRATQMVKQTGSSIKPIADVAPALQEKVITPATVYNDSKTDFNGYSPKNDGDRYRGFINIRQFIATSQNVPAVKIMKELTPKKSLEYLKKMGISSLDDKNDNELPLATVYNDSKTDFNGYSPKNDGDRYRGFINIRQFIATSQNVPAVKIMKELTPKKSLEYLKKMGISSLDDKNDNELPLAIGGLTHGVSPLEMAAAYGTIANDGVYITPTFYTKVTDSSGNVVLTPKQEQTRVFSEQVAYLTRSITEEPVKSGGTATYCNITGIETCAKTGTTDGSKDRWLCGMTPYYSAAVWFGYDSPEEVVYNGTNPAGQIWSSVMKSIHKNLKNANFNTPSGITQATVCRKTGCLATSGCTDTYTEQFAQDNLPEKCEGHGVQKICTESGKLATQYCPQTRNSSYGGTVPKETLNLWNTNGASKTAGGKITETCTIHTKPAEQPKEVEKPKDNTTNTANNGNKTNTNTNTNSTSTNSTNTKKDDKTNSGTKTDGTSSTTTNTPSTDTTKTDTNKKHQ